MPKTRAYQAPSVTPELSCGSQLIKDLPVTNIPAGPVGLYTMLGAPSFKEDYWMDKNLNPYLLFSVECWQEQKGPFWSFNILYDIVCLVTTLWRTPIALQTRFTLQLDTVSPPVCWVNLVAEPLPGSKFVTVEWLVLKKHPLNQGTYPNLGGGNH